MPRAKDVGYVLVANGDTDLSPRMRTAIRRLGRGDDPDPPGECMVPLAADPAHEDRIVAHMHRVQAELRALGLVRDESGLLRRGAWTKTEDARALALWKQGRSMAAIGSDLGRSKSAVAARLHRLTGRIPAGS